MLKKIDALNYVTKELEPKNVFKYFEQLSQIPRGSGNEKEVSDFLLEFGNSLGFESIQDDVMNIIIKKPGTKNYENSPIVILQGHMDMVCEKNSNTVHNFLKDPLKLFIDGDLLKAKGTTLGADNGIAVAYAMAVLASKDISHPPLEVIITVEEETGMGGVIGFDKKNVDGKILINIDSEEEGVFFASCAGGIRSNILLDIKREEEELEIYKINISGLKGGHSGLNINDGRGNAIKILGRLLNDLSAFDYRIIEISGGSKPNAIPREAEVIIGIKNITIDKLEEVIYKSEKIFNNELINTDELQINIKKYDSDLNPFTKEVTRKVVDALMLFPSGVDSISFSIDGLVESSISIGVLSEVDNILVFESAIRSSVKSKKYEILNRVKILAKLLDGKTEELSDYPEWAYNSNSKLQDVFKYVYKKTTGKDGKIDAIHAGLECGFFAEKLTDIGDGSDLDMISLGPNMSDVHTPDESLSISSVEKTWIFLKAVLKELK